MVPVHHFSLLKHDQHFSGRLYIQEYMAFFFLLFFVSTKLGRYGVEVSLGKAAEYDENGSWTWWCLPLIPALE